MLCLTKKKTQPSKYQNKEIHVQIIKTKCILYFIKIVKRIGLLSEHNTNELTIQSVTI